MSILIFGTEKLAETVNIPVKWGSTGLSKMVKAGTPLTATGEIATGATAAAVRGIVAIDYGYSPYANSCPCIVAGVVDLTKVQFKYSSDQDPIVLALDQISFIDGNKKVYHPSVVSQIASNSLDGAKLATGTVQGTKLVNGSVPAAKLASGVLPGRFINLLYAAYDEAGALVFEYSIGVLFVPAQLETNRWNDLLLGPMNPVVLSGGSAAYWLTTDAGGAILAGEYGVFGVVYGDEVSTTRVTTETDITDYTTYVVMEVSEEPTDDEPPAD